MQQKLARTRILGIGFLSLVALMIIFSSYTIVGPGHRGVVVMLGRVEQTTLGEGFHLVVPPVLRQVVEVDVRTKKMEVDAEAASSDMQLIQVKGVLNYHLDPQAVSSLYRDVGLDFENIIIAPPCTRRSRRRRPFRVERILVERAAIKEEIQSLLEARLENNIVVDQFSLANVEFSDEFNAAIERKQVAEQAALQKQYELQAAQRTSIALATAEGQKKAPSSPPRGAPRRARSRRRPRPRPCSSSPASCAAIPTSSSTSGRPGSPGGDGAPPSDQDLILSADSLVKP